MPVALSLSREQSKGVWASAEAIVYRGSTRFMERFAMPQEVILFTPLHCAFGRKFRPMPVTRLAILIFTLIAATPSHAARCGGDFNSFVQNISTEAASAGISQGVISQALGGVQQDMGVLAFDRRQRGTFNKTFEQYVSTRVGAGRINGGRAMLQRRAALLSSIEQKVGGPPPVPVAIWGLRPISAKAAMAKCPGFPCPPPWRLHCRAPSRFQPERPPALKP